MYTAAYVPINQFSRDDPPSPPRPPPNSPKEEALDQFQSPTPSRAPYPKNQSECDTQNTMINLRSENPTSPSPSGPPHSPQAKPTEHFGATDALLKIIRVQLGGNAAPLVPPPLPSAKSEELIKITHLLLKIIRLKLSDTGAPSVQPSGPPHSPSMRPDDCVEGEGSPPLSPPLPPLPPFPVLCDQAIDMHQLGRGDRPPPPPPSSPKAKPGEDSDPYTPPPSPTKPLSPPLTPSPHYRGVLVACA